MERKHGEDARDATGKLISECYCPRCVAIEAENADLEGNSPEPECNIGQPSLI